MAIQPQLPKHIEVAAKTAVLIAKPKDDLPYKQIAMELDLTAASQTFVDLGGVPLPTEDPKIVETLVEKSQDITPKDFYLTVSLSQNAIDDDQTGTVKSKFMEVLPSFQRHINKSVFETLNGGDGTTYGLCYDGQQFFDSDHADAGGKYQTDQDNEYDLVLNLDNFETVLIAAQGTLDDVGNYTNFDYNLVVTSPTLQRTVHQIAANPNAYDVANNELNPYNAGLSYLISPYMDSTAWVLIANNESTKPIFVAIRKRPQLIDVKFDGQGGDGGMHHFTYHGRYVIDYGDWRLAYLGNS